jgi:hypothetical protein
MYDLKTLHPIRTPKYSVLEADVMTTMPRRRAIFYIFQNARFSVHHKMLFKIRVTRCDCEKTPKI